jgi:hypothetical protein
MARILVLVALALGVIVVVALVAGALRWSAGTRDLRARIEAARQPIEPRTVNFRELEGLPAPVARYFRAALTDGQPMIAGARVRHRGTFNMGEQADNWRPFTSDQVVVTRRPGFDWDARISMLPGITVRVHDGYVAGEGILYASLFGLIPLMNVTGTPGVAEGELMRFLAEAPWYPTVLLPSQGLAWEAADDRSAHATLTDGDIRLTLRFTFGDDGLIAAVRSESRGRLVDGVAVPTPWEGRTWNYVERDGMRVPLEGEVAWIVPGGPRAYWRGRIEQLEYEFAR